MELNPGYKQTEVGVIPEDWEVSPISSLLPAGSRITYGVVQPGPLDLAGVLFIRGGDVFDGKILTNQLRTISTAVSRLYKRTQLAGGEIVVSLVGYPGESAVVPPSLLGANIARQVALIRIDQRLLNSADYVCWFLRSPIGRHLLLKESIGSAQQVINLRDINRLEVALPKPAEQRAIATALSDVDGLLGGLERLIAKKRDLKQAAMQQLLNAQTRLPGFHGNWQVKRLGELFNFSGGYSASRDQLSTEGHCYLHYGDIHGSTKTCIDADADFQNIPKLDIPLQRVSRASLLDDGDVVFVDAS